MWSVNDRVNFFKYNPEVERRKRIVKRLRAFHFVRMSAEIRMGDALSASENFPARVFGGDFQPDRIFLSTVLPLEAGSRVSIALHDSPRVYMKGQVVECHRFALENNVISENPHPYRIQVDLEFGSEVERDRIKQAAINIHAKYVLKDATKPIDPRLLLPKVVPLKAPEQT